MLFKAFVRCRTGIRKFNNRISGNLIVGERQWKCIKRAILKKSLIEATANIDIKTEHKSKKQLIKHLLTTL
jgi:ABC-type multidrug transport system fused ATPase/permease subunit